MTETPDTNIGNTNWQPLEFPGGGVGDIIEARKFGLTFITLDLLEGKTFPQEGYVNTDIGVQEVILVQQGSIHALATDEGNANLQYTLGPGDILNIKPGLTYSINAIEDCTLAFMVRRAEATGRIDTHKA